MSDFWKYLAFAGLLSCAIDWTIITWLRRRERRLQALAADAIAELAAVICSPGVDIAVWRETQAKIEALDDRSLDLGVYR
jgi:hypothetical protein